MSERTPLRVMVENDLAEAREHIECGMYDSGQVLRGLISSLEKALLKSKPFNSLQCDGCFDYPCRCSRTLNDRIWLPTDGVLPTDGEPVWICLNRYANPVAQARRIAGRWVLEDDTQGPGYTIGAATHWMPRPLPIWPEPPSTSSSHPVGK